MNHYVTMFCIMILSGLMSTMNVWVDKVTDMRLSLNDGYMILLMTGWMLLFMGLLDWNWLVAVFGLVLVSAMLWCIRTQYAVSSTQYLQGMIPHHSMAIHMSRRLLEKYTPIQDFAQSIIKQQELEIEYMQRLP